MDVKVLLCISTCAFSHLCGLLGRCTSSAACIYYPHYFLPISESRFGDCNGYMVEMERDVLWSE